MEAVFPDLMSIQDGFREEFGWALEDDISSALKLKETCKQPKAIVRFTGTVTVVGAAASSNVFSENPIIAADGAVGSLKTLENLKLVVTDCDGYPYLTRAIEAHIPLAIHAHGDNVEEWKRTLAELDEEHPVLLTHQTPLYIPEMSNPGGFTDGDRAVCIAFALGAEQVELVGFSSSEVGKWSCETNPERKQIKLQWMKEVLSILNLEVLDE
ncbi:MAG: hypothetical protein QGI21_05365 [Candidatus Poseidoniaceae archaeon]|nr:hypothetical protein [Candidatus Poseidoniaceae archaeon]